MRLANPFKTIKKADWVRIVVRAVIVCGLVAIGENLWLPASLEDALRNGAYNITQEQLQQRPNAADMPLVLVDLSKLIKPLYSGQDKRSSPGTWLALADIVEEIKKAKPKAILVDWDLGLDPASRNSEGNGGLSKESKEIYKRVLERLSKVNAEIPVRVLADSEESALANSVSGTDALLKPMAASGRIAPEPPALHQTALAYVHADSGSLPLFADFSRLLPSSNDFHDFASSTKSRLAYAGELPGVDRDTIWIDYGYLPQLLAKCVDCSAVELVTAAPNGPLISRLRGEYVLIGDISDPTPPDRYTIPLPYHAKVGESDIAVGSGVLVHASAILTRHYGPLYSMQRGFTEALILTLLAAIISIASEVVGHAFHGHEKAHRIQALCEVFFLAASASIALGVLYTAGSTHFLFLGAVTFGLTRLFDGLLGAGWALASTPQTPTAPSSGPAVLPSPDKPDPKKDASNPIKEGEKAKDPSAKKRRSNKQRGRSGRRAGKRHR